ncbi:MAG TPA: HAD family hydrolase [Thermoanaerobaculia bacterium]|jgi:2-haloacid dehalogenase/putative hydrolase of the HAD superfamily
MDRRYDVITFDCYGTLIDWRSGIANAFLRAAREDGITLRAEDVLREYNRIEPVVERERYRLYRDVLGETAFRVAHALGWPLAFARATFLAESLPRWQPFPDTNAALARLRGAGYRLGILSNTDDDLLAATRRHFTVGFDLIITAQQLKSYKPALPHFTAAREWIGDAPWLHAAESNFHDIVPTNAIGVPNAWVNRNRESALPKGTPLFEVGDLRELAELLAPKP